MLIAIIVIVILTYAYLVYLLVRLHGLINRAHKEMDMPKEPWDDDPMIKLLRSKATFDSKNYAEAAPEPESIEEAIQKEFGPRPEESQKMYDRQFDVEVSMHPRLTQMRMNDRYL
jgi:hypothetical protein